MVGAHIKAAEPDRRDGRDHLAEPLDEWADVVISAMGQPRRSASLTLTSGWSGAGPLFGSAHSRQPLAPTRANRDRAPAVHRHQHAKRPIHDGGSFAAIRPERWSSE